MALTEGTGRLVPVSGTWSRRVASELAATDWEDVVVVDVVTFAPATSRGFEGDRQRTELYRYRDQAPPPDAYENGERSYRVERVTEPVYRQCVGDDR